MGKRGGLLFAPAERNVYRRAIGPRTALQRSAMWGLSESGFRIKGFAGCLDVENADKQKTNSFSLQRSVMSESGCTIPRTQGRRLRGMFRKAPENREKGGSTQGIFNARRNGTEGIRLAPEGRHVYRRGDNKISCFSPRGAICL